jgi:two-component system chemotaxis response regulator CheY
MRSLVAEDDATSRMLLQKFLSKFGECDIAVDGKEAVRTVKAARLAKRGYDLVCMDLNMPIMNGQEAIREIREHESTAEVLRPTKIIVTTAQTDLGSITMALLGKCNAYLMKPIDTRKLQSELQEIGLIKK